MEVFLFCLCVVQVVAPVTS